MQCPFKMLLGLELITKHIVRRSQHRIDKDRIFRTSSLHAVKQRFRERRRPFDEMFATVKDKEGRGCAQALDQGRHDVVCLHRQAKQSRHGRRHERSVTKRA
jgi:hypothetical protein